MFQSVRRKMYTCSECGKSFRTPDDLYLHAEVCLLDAFEMEASAILADPSLADAPLEDIPTGGATGALINNNIGSVPTEDYQGIFRPYFEPKRDRRPVSTVNAQNRLYEENPYSAPPVGRNKNVARVPPVVSGKSVAFVEDFEDDEDAPPHLELAEPQSKKYKRIFPIGEDGKQIRPKMECPTCGLVLYRHNFSTHYRIHTGELPFQCSFCDKRFRTSSALTVHTRCHTGDKPYNCPHCEYSCITKRNLDRHIINNHVKRTRRTRFVRMSSGHTAIVRRRGRPPMSAYANYSDRVLINEDVDANDMATNENREQRVPYGRRRGSLRKFRDRPAIIGASRRTVGGGDAQSVAVAARLEAEEEDEDEEVVTYHVTEEEMERIMRAAEAEGVVIQQEDNNEDDGDDAEQQEQGDESLLNEELRDDAIGDDMRELTLGDIPTAVENNATH